MDIKISNKELKEAIVKKAAEVLLKDKSSWIGTNYPLRILAESIIKETPEIREIVKDLVKEKLQDKYFLQDAIRQIFIDELKYDAEE